MLKIKVTEKSGASIEYQMESVPDLSAFGHGRPERWQREYSRWEPKPGVEAYDKADVIKEEDRPNPVTGDLERWVKLKADYTVEITDITQEHALKECISSRLKEYPSASDFLNAFFDEGDAGLERLKALRLEIKAKYPKP
jgi:hypothetical protein